MSTVSMTQAQVGALHDLAVAFGACDLDATEQPNQSLTVTVHTPTSGGDRSTVAWFSVSVAGTVRSREPVAA